MLHFVICHPACICCVRGAQPVFVSDGLFLMDRRRRISQFTVCGYVFFCRHLMVTDVKIFVNCHSIINLPRMTLLFVRCVANV